VGEAVRRCAAALLALALGIAPLGAHADAGDDLTTHVDPTIGTLEGGFAFPGAAAPYGMVQNSPDTEGQFAYTGYQWGDQFIRGFSLVHVESMGVQEGGYLPFMPTTGAPSSNVLEYESKFEHITEEAEAGYYAVDLDEYLIRAELTAGTRVGMQRYTFKAGGPANVIIDAGRQIAGGATESWETTPGTAIAHVRKVDNRTVVGGETPASNDRDYYKAFFAARFSKPFETFGVWDARGATPHVADDVTGNGAGAYVSWADPGSVTMKVAVSFVSEENALLNLDTELAPDDYDFDALRARTRAAWNDALHAIKVTGGTDLEKTSFYSALYRAQLHPNVFNDVNGDYRGYDDAVHRIGSDGIMPAGSTYYANYSLWDTYRAEMPLLEMISPDRVRDMMRSLAAIGVQGGRLPKWGLQYKYADYMIGEPALQTVADAWCRGLVPDDVADELYASLRKLSEGNPHNDGPRFDQYHYVPNDLSGVGASTTMEQSSGEFAFALLADALGETGDAVKAQARAGYWRNVFDDETRFVRPRLKNGQFVADYHPELPDGFKEGTGWQWTWLVPQDVAGLATKIGDDQVDGMTARLDRFFDLQANYAPLVVGQAQTTATVFGIAYYGNQYAPSNEHDLQAPFLYNWFPGHAGKTQLLARQHQGLFRPTPDGLPGNDDLGTMSAWFVWSALGFYPVIPGAPLVMVGSPMFEKAEIRVPGGTFTVEAPGASLVGKFIQSATLDGERLAETYFSVAEIAAGSVAHFQMGPAPNMAFWSSPASAPPSQSTSPLSAFGCTPG
jgi:predicted alpha-1,2-mannosidase